MSTAEQHRYDVMVRESLSTTGAAFSDIPALECRECGHCVSFGGCLTFEQGQFTVDDVCMCWPIVCTEG